MIGRSGSLWLSRSARHRRASLTIIASSYDDAGRNGRCRLDTVTKAKTVSLIQKSLTIMDADRKYAETVYPMVQDSIKEGIFLPRRNGSLCSRRYCGFW